MPKVSPQLSLSPFSMLIQGAFTSSEITEALLKNCKSQNLKDLGALDLSSVVFRIMKIADENEFLFRTVGDKNGWVQRKFKEIYSEFIATKAYENPYSSEEKSLIQNITEVLINKDLFAVVRSLKNKKDKKIPKDPSVTFSDDELLQSYKSSIHYNDIAKFVYDVYQANDSLALAIQQINRIIDRIFPIQQLHLSSKKKLKITENKDSLLSQKIIKLMAAKMIAAFDEIAKPKKISCTIL